jgi:Cdc6-like AAA superfamily ATPase
MGEQSNNVSKLRRYAEVAAVFTPGAPIDDVDLFAGRMSQVMDVVNALSQRGQHVVLFGERGVGKTSLANVLAEFFGGAQDVRSVKVNCSTNDTYRSLWANIFRELRMAEEAEKEWAGGQPDPESIRYLLQRVQTRTLIVIDELDRLEDGDALSQLADTVKTLSDHSVHTTLVLVGVADSIDDLVGDHRSIERALTQIPMQRMSTEELTEILSNGLGRLGLGIDVGARDRIALLSEGLPHYTHLLALHATQRAVMDDRERVLMTDVDSAVETAVSKAQQSIRSAYQRATRSPRKESKFAEVLLACALTEKDELGYFTASSVRAPLSEILGKRVEIPAFARHLNKFTEPSRACVLQKSGEERRYFYRFGNPLLQPYVILSGLAHGVIDEDLVRKVHALSRQRPGHTQQS